MLHRKIAAVAVVFLMVGMTCASDLQNEQITRLQALTTRAAAGKATIGDMHEAATHYRILAARMRDSGLETQVDAALRNPANQTRLMNACVNSKFKGVDATVCQSALSLLRSNGSHMTMQAIASVAYQADLWAPGLIPTEYGGGARLLPVVLPSCRGVGQSLAAATFISATFLIIPGGEPAGLVGGVFTTFLAMIYAGVC